MSHIISFLHQAFPFPARTKKSERKKLRAKSVKLSDDTQKVIMFIVILAIILLAVNLENIIAK